MVLQKPPVTVMLDEATKLKSLADIKESLRKRIFVRLCETARLPFRDRQLFADCIQNIMEKHGLFIENFGKHYYFETETGKLISLSKKSNDLGVLLSNDYRLNPVEPVSKFTLAQIMTYARSNSQTIALKSFSTYDEPSNTLYLHTSGNGILKIAADSKPETISGGINSAIFKEERVYSEWNYIPKEERNPEKTIMSLLIDPIPFADEISREAFAVLLQIWIISILFPELMPTRPILAFIGEKGCGKSTALRNIGLMLFGKTFNVSANIPDSKDLETALVSLALVALDNLDGSVYKVQDLLATAATGGKFTKRKLYSDGSLYSISMRAYIAVTSRTPRFKRPDLVSRVLRMELMPIENMVAQNTIEKEILNNRDSLMSKLADTCSEILFCLKETEAENITVNTRMADFATFALRISPAIGVSREKMENFLIALTEDQEEFLCEENPLLDLFTEWLNSELGNYGTEFTPTELFRALADFANENKFSLEAKTPTTLGKKINQYKNLLEKMLGLEIKEMGGRRKIYCFRGKSAEYDE